MLNLVTRYDHFTHVNGTVGVKTVHIYPVKSTLSKGYKNSFDAIKCLKQMHGQLINIVLFHTDVIP